MREALLASDFVPDISAAAADMKTIATVLFGLAIVHTFSVKQFLKLSHKFRPGSIGENLFHFLGEVEVVFGVWAGVLVFAWAARHGVESSVQYLDTVNFTEAAFVFVIMCMAATRPVMALARRLINLVAWMLPLPRAVAFYATALIVGPLLGSVITEPAAMTVTALLLLQTLFSEPSRTSLRFRYATLGLLFVNVSIGGTLTHFAAPPVLMVAKPWGWDTPFMLQHFGWRAAIAVVIGTAATTLVFFRELRNLPLSTGPKRDSDPPIWMSVTHVAFMALTVAYAHHMSFFIPLFLFFLGWTVVTNEHQDELKLKESLLVAFFLGGLVTLGKLQGWWIQPLITGRTELELFWGAAGLTAFTDNAALTYLGTLVPSLSAEAKYALVAGAVTGGGLTVIANAPNPAGYGILSPMFGEDGISPAGLLLGALPFTLFAGLLFLL